ncbi:MAG TPA: S9 family peptidase, partial [Thermoanaerobaculia bacterium]|nr:S9 family peptidase [Thermoanaerobaculia bacterium]
MNAILVVLLLSLAEQRPFTLDDEMKLRSIVDVKISPDGERVAYVVSTPNLGERASRPHSSSVSLGERSQGGSDRARRPLAAGETPALPDNEHVAALYVVNSAGGVPTRLAEKLHIINKPLPRPGLRWSPDGTMLSLIAIVGEKPQVFAIPISGAEPRQLTDAAEGVSGFEWSPDGTNIAYLTRDVAEKQLVIHADAPDQATRVAVRSVKGGAPRMLTPPTDYVDNFSWSPDGSTIAYSAAPRSGFSSQYETRIYSISVDGSRPRLPIVDRPGMNSKPLFSPDGKWIAFISTNGRAELIAPRSLAIVDVQTHAPRMLQTDGTWVNEFLWARDSKSIYYEANEGTFASGEHMFEQPIVRMWIEGGRSERVIPGPIVNYSPSLSADGRRLAYRAVEGRTMGDVFVLDTASGRSTKLTDVNPQLHDLALGDLKAVKWKSFDDMEIWGLLLTPPGWTAGRKLPMIVYCHGGPVGGVTYGLFPQFMHIPGQVDPYPTEAMASAGYAVLFPMPRGGSGYGEPGMRMIVNSWGEGDYRDIMAGVDDMIRRGIADPDRLGVMGASYGGYMTSWIVTQTGRFKAASTGASLNDLTDEYFLSDAGDFMIEYWKRPWENREGYASHSALTFADRVTTPLLIQHGENDRRVPIAGAWKFYKALKALGKTVEFDIYPRGGHVLFEP